MTEGYGLPTLLVALANLPDLEAMLPTAAAATGRIATAGAAEAFKTCSAVRQHELVYLFGRR